MNSLLDLFKDLRFLKILLNIGPWTPQAFKAWESTNSLNMSDGNKKKWLI